MHQEHRQLGTLKERSSHPAEHMLTQQAVPQAADCQKIRTGLRGRLGKLLRNWIFGFVQCTRLCRHAVPSQLPGQMVYAPRDCVN